MSNQNAGYSEPRALIVEDSAATRKILRDRLASFGFGVFEAENAAEGLRQFRERHPCLVTLDLIMPSVNGLSSEDLLKLIRTEDFECAIVVISSRARSSSAPAFFAQGAIAYLEKPFLDFERLQETVDRLFPHEPSISRRRSARANQPALISCRSRESHALAGELVLLIRRRR